LLGLCRFGHEDPFQCSLACWSVYLKDAQAGAKVAASWFAGLPIWA
jgi:hypothetical protein